MIGVDSILAESDGIMVARGDLAPAVEFIRLPEAQDELVAAARRAGKTVVVATQILECFAETGVPQRSELSGLSLLARQCPDAIMLGKETVYQPSAHRGHSFCPRSADLRGAAAGRRTFDACRAAWRLQGPAGDGGH